MDVTSTGPPLSNATSHLAASFSNVRTEVMAAAADKLGISVERLRSEVAAGKPLSDLLAIASAGSGTAPPQPAQPSVALVDEAHGSQVDVRL